MKLAECTNVGAGHAFRGRIEARKDSGIYAIQMRDVTQTGEIRWDLLTETEPVTSRPVFLSEGDILLAKHGLRNYAVLVSEPPADHKLLAAPHWFVIRCERHLLLPEFLAWQLNRSPAQTWFQRHTTGSTTPMIRRQAVEELPLSVPPLAKQEAIIGLARAMHRERELCEKLMTETESLNDELARQLLQDH